MAKKKRRGSSMGRGTRISRKNRKMGKKWLTVPDGFSMYREEPDTKIKMDFLAYEVKDIKNHPESEAILEDIWYRFPYRLHRNAGPNRIDILCPSTIGKACPICEQRQAIFDDPDADNKQASKFFPSPRSLFVIKIKGGDKKNKDKIFLWDISNFCFWDQVDIELDTGEEEWEDFACLEGGSTLSVRFIEKSIDGTKFAKTDRIDFLERDDYDESILEETTCLDDVIVPNIPSYSEIEAILDGEEPEEKEKEEVKEKPKKKAPKKTKKKKEPIKLEWDDIAEADEEELIKLAEERDFEPDEDDYDDEDELRDLLVEEFEIEKPKKKAPKKTKKKTPKKEKKVTNKKQGHLKCPFAYKYGEEWGDHDECTEEDCEKHDDCFDVYDEMQDE